MSYKEKIKALILKAINGNEVSFSVEKPKIKEHGDVSTNAAMLLAKSEKKNPFEIANEIKSKLASDEKLIKKIEVVKPGFINFFLGDDILAESIFEVFLLKEQFGFEKEKSKEKILVEYVSTNPTGDLHIGHGRQAVIGSSLVNLLKAAGYDVSSEFYINDFGEQIQKLKESAWAAFRKLRGDMDVIWKEEYYPYDTLVFYIKNLLESRENLSEENIAEEVKNIIIDSQKKLLNELRVEFDVWFSETSLHKNNSVHKAIEKLKENNFVYKEEGALWFKAKEFNDVRDRVLVRSDGRPTYLAADVAYHENKLKRGFQGLINLWGADHHGQEVGLKGALKALGEDENKLDVIFVQLVSLKKENQEVKMSKRAGTVVTTEEVLNDVGVDAFRYFLVESHPNNRMVFDLDLAKRQDKENPVYYIQYAHARCASIIRQALEVDISINKPTKDIFLELFNVKEDEYNATKNLALKILDFPYEVIQAAALKSPSRIAIYLKELASELHQFYTVCRVIAENKNLSMARVGLVQATKITISNGLKILGISAPDKM